MRNSLSRIVIALVATVGVAALWIIPSYANQQSQPGVSPARFWINNRTREEAIPVSIANVDPKAPPMPVTVGGVAVIDFGDRAVGTLSQVQGRTQNIVRKSQPWEYREVPFAANQPMAAGLNQLGSEGWEVTGITTQPNGNITVLLKRPR